jgi:hypothetical protein
MAAKLRNHLRSNVIAYLAIAYFAIAYLPLFLVLRHH